MSEPEKVEKKEKKEKKVLTPERLEQLARARKKALEIRQAGASLKEEQKQLADAALEEKLQRERELNEAVKKSLIKNEINNEGLQTAPLYRNNVVPNIARQERYEEEEEEEEEEVQHRGRPIRDYTEASARRQPRKKPIKTKVVIEQSSDDEDEFHTNEHVIFVKRKSKNDSIKKVVPATTPVPPNTPEEQPLRKVAPNERVWDASHRQLPTTPLANTMDDFVNAGFTNYRKYY